MFVIEEVQTIEQIKQFTDLPNSIYSKSKRPTSKKLELSIINGTHPLSHMFKVKAYIVKLDNEVISRAIMTMYSNTSEAYFGFFESKNNIEACKKLVDECVLKASDLGYNELVGPVNSSFWIGYRMKINMFERDIYSFEPHNPKYYLKLFEECGFVPKYLYRTKSLETNERFSIKKFIKERYDKYYKNDVIVYKGNEYLDVSIKKSEFDNTMKEIYRLVMDTFSSKPLFQYITYDEFIELYSDLKYVIDYKLSTLTYYNGEVIAFNIITRDFNNLSSLNLLKYMFIKLFGNKYVYIYSASVEEHRGINIQILNNYKKYYREYNVTLNCALMIRDKLSDRDFNYMLYTIPIEK